MYLQKRLEHVGSFTRAEWSKLLDDTGHRCVGCGIAEASALYRKPRRKAPVFGKLTRDHMLPVSRGGSNTIDNMQPLCWYCNRQKHNRHIDYLHNGKFGIKPRAG